jgi:DNA-3-methyladenine glycosylase I
MLKEELEFKFDYLGGTTVFHFLTDLGFNVLKPDRVIARIFKRLGLIESEQQLLKTVIIGRKFASATELPIRYIDVIFVKYGQQGKSEEFGLSNGICLNHNPSCHICGLESFCKYTRS